MSVHLAWAAGFFDGEGSTCCDREGHRLYVTIGQVNRQNLEKFQAAVGGSGIIGKPRVQGGVGQPAQKFVAYGADAHLILQRLSPYLGTEKLGQAVRALMRYSFRTVRNRIGVRGSVCKRGHSGATYRNPSRGLECDICRRARRLGPLPPLPPAPLAIELGIGAAEWTVDKYPARNAVASTYGMTGQEYAPVAET